MGGSDVRPGVPLLLPGNGSSRGKLAQKAYARAVFRLDARYNPAHGVPTDLSANALPIQSGSTAGSDTNDPLWLPAPATYGVGRYVAGSVGSGNNFGSIAHSAALAVSGTVTIVAEIAHPTWAGPFAGLVGKWNTGQKHYLLGFDAFGRLIHYYTLDGSTDQFFVCSASLSSLGLTAWQKVYVASQFIPDNGSGGRECRFFWSLDGTSWNQLGNTETGGAVTPFVSTGGNVGLLGGVDFRLFSARVIAGTLAGGTAVLDFDLGTATVDATQTNVTDKGVTAIVGRAATGRKTVVVEAPKWLLGTDDFFEVVDNDLLDIDAATDFTVLAVLRQYATPVSNGRWVSKWSASTANAGWSLNAAGPDLAPSVGIVDTAGDSQSRSTSGGVTSVFTAGSLQTLGFLVNRTAATLAAVRGAGALSATASTSAVGDCGNAYPVRIGVEAATLARYQDFELYAVYIWREALTASELAAIAADWGAA